MQKFKASLTNTYTWNYARYSPGELVTSDMCALAPSRSGSWGCTILQGLGDGRGGISGMALPRLPEEELRCAVVS